ncbi:hypothetical protein RHMOL_Rhmol01G0169400 [Rhododendron molle]|uniref:Uncharacterized protein n=1 Tax=Rhododendron molle TaxID=49168 RepID=A0ACC0Q5M3_RHOML|nr:hypothetical protein RHMOL_Rhmol01G0169400 [Rhododendron molle]
MADHGNGGHEGEVVDRPEDRGGPMGTETEDQTAAMMTEDQGAVVGGNGDDCGDREQEAGNDEEHRATEVDPCATDLARAVGPRVELVGSGTVAEDSSIVGRSSGGGDSSGAVGDDPGPNVSPPRDSARGKGIVAEEEETTDVPVEYREEDVAFQPAVTAATSSSHVPITKYDIAEHLRDEMLAKLLEDNPTIGEMVLRAKEEQAQAIAASEAAERAKRE